MAPGCAERLSLKFLRWIWRYPIDSRPRIVNGIATGGGHVAVVTVATRTHVENLLRACTQGGPAQHAVPDATGRARSPQ